MPFKECDADMMSLITVNSLSGISVFSVKEEKKPFCYGAHYYYFWPYVLYLLFSFLDVSNKGLASHSVINHNEPYFVIKAEDRSLSFPLR